MVEDRRLVKRLRRGDKDALRRLYEKYKDDLLTIAACLLNDPEAAEDILHDVFVSFARVAGQLRLYSGLRSYLITCVVNRVRDRFRRKMYQVVELKRAAELASTDARPEQITETNEQLRLACEALAAIPFEQREVVILRLHGGCKFREIAALQNTSVNTAQGRYRYGLNKLRELLDG